MESKMNAWEMFEKSEDKKQFLIKLAACIEKPIQMLVSKLSSVRQLATVTEFKDGNPTFFQKPSDFDKAVSIFSDHSVRMPSSNEKSICAQEVEVCVQIPLIQNTINSIGMLLAEKLADEEDALYQKLLNRAEEAIGKCLFGVRRKPIVLPVMDGTTKKWDMVAFELISMVLPYKNPIEKESK